MRKFLSILLISTVLATHAATWKDIEFLPVTTPQWGEAGPCRSAQLRVNNGRNKPAHVQAILRIQDYEHPVLIVREVTVQPNAGVLLDFPVPANREDINKLEYNLVVDGEKAFSALPGSMAFHWGGQYNFVVASRKIPESLVKILSAEENNLFCNYSPLPFEQWATDDRSYQEYLPILLQDKGMQSHVLMLSANETLPPAQQHALQRWVHCGGRIVRVVMPDDPWPTGIPGEKDGNHWQQDGLGYEVYWRPIPSKRLAEWKKQEPSLTGSIDKALLTKLSKDGLKPDAQMVRCPPPASGWLERLLPVPPGIPILALVLLMAIFVALAFPVSFFWLQKRHREYWLFWTTPLFSVLFCLLVFLLITFHDGLGIKVNSNGFTWLDQESKMARTFAVISVLSPFAPSQPLKFEREDTLFFSRKSALVVENAPGQVINPSIVSPRNVLNISTSRFGTRTERLRVIRNSDGTVEIVNGLGAPLEKFCWLDEEGTQLWSASSPVPAGGRARLQKQPVSIPFVFQAPLVDRFSEMVVAATKIVPSQVEEEEDTSNKEEQSTLFCAELLSKCAPGYFIAVLNKPVFYTTGIQTKKSVDTQVVFGPVKAE